MDTTSTMPGNAPPPDRPTAPIHTHRTGAPVAPPASTAAARPWQLLAWAASSAQASQQYATQLADYLKETALLADATSRLRAAGWAAAGTLADVAFTLHSTHPPLDERRFVLAANVLEATQALHRLASSGSQGAGPLPTVPGPGPLVFVFPGQQAQYPNMGRELYGLEPAFRAAVDECASLLHSTLGTDLRAVMYPTLSAGAGSPAAARQHDPAFTHPALFVTEYALAQLWQSWGVRPTALCGHGIGGLVAACLAGIFTLADALRLVVARGRLVGELPLGRLLAMPVEVGPPLSSEAASQAICSGAMAAAAAEMQRLVAQVPASAPRLPLLSATTGTWVTPRQALDPAYWASQLVGSVRLTAALQTILSEVSPLLLEVGPGTALTSLARQCAAGRACLALASLPDSRSQQSDYQTLLPALGQLWQAGLNPDWPAFYAGQARRLVPLPE